MKKHFLFYSLGALLCVATTMACSSDDDSKETQTTQKIDPQKTYVLTLTASKEAKVDASRQGQVTRALSESDGTLTATWAKGEEVYVLQSGSSKGYLSPKSTGEATSVISGTVSGLVMESEGSHANLDLLFPRATIDYTGQKGTLADIAENFDYATASTIVNVGTEGEALKPSSGESTNITFTNQQAIVKFTLKDGEAEVLASKLTISADGLKQNSSTTGDITITPTSPSSVIYAALSGITSPTTITISAVIGDKTYTITKSDKTFAHGGFYRVTLKNWSTKE